MKQFIFRWLFTARLTRLLPALAGCAAILCSCESGPEKPVGDLVFRFTVMLYKEPVEITWWEFDPAQSANPEGAALNIVYAMQIGDVDKWLSCWEEADRPKLTKEDREALRNKWKSTMGGREILDGRVVADADLVMELKVRNPPQAEQRLRLPLKRDQGQWWLTTLAPDSKFLNWENAPDKIVVYRENFALETYLISVKKRHK